MRYEDKCEARDGEDRCALRRGHAGHHEDAQGRPWPTRRERSGEVVEHDASLDLARLVRGEDDGRWWIMPAAARVEAGAAVEGAPVVMYAFRSRDHAEAVCVTVNVMALADAMGDVAEEEQDAAAA